MRKDLLWDGRPSLEQRHTVHVININETSELPVSLLWAVVDRAGVTRFCSHTLFALAHKERRRKRVVVQIPKDSRKIRQERKDPSGDSLIHKARQHVHQPA